jgi:hypothetical protein
VKLRGAAITMLMSSMLLLAPALVGAQTQQPSAPGNSVLMDLGFTLHEVGPDKNSISFTKRGLLVPTPWGGFEATAVSTPADHMVRVPLSPNTDAAQPLVQPYVTAGTRRSVDDDPALETSRLASYGSELSRGSGLKAGAGLLLKLDERVEFFGEYQFMRVQRQGGTGVGSVGAGLDSTGFSLGLSVRY